MGKAGRKSWFPPRKWRVPLSGGALLLVWLLAAGGVQAQDQNRADLAARVTADAERQVQRYARQRGWVNFDYQVDAWVPGAADQHPGCQGELVVAPAQASGRIWGRVPYRIGCSEPEWELRARAEVSLKVPVVTARRTVRRGESLNRDTMRLAVRDLADIYGDFVTDIRMLRGLRTRRAIRGGQVITLDLAEAPLLVERGDQVLIRVEADGVAASMTGEALQSGSKGEGIRVRNHSSGKVITAWVVERGIVETRF